MTQLFPYEQELLRSLRDEIDRWKKRLDYRQVLARRWEGRLRRDLEAEAVAASTAMEGVPVTAEEVRRILAEQPAAEVREEDRSLVRGYRDAMNFVSRRADDPAFRWNRELIVGLHDRILAGRYDLGAGRLRTDRPAFVVNSATGEQVFLPPPGEDVEHLVDEVCSVMDRGLPHPAIASAWVHVAMAAIHPFKDGNGRTARVLASLAMYRGGFKRTEFTSLEEWWGRHRGDYYSAFRCLGPEFHRNADITPFVQAHMEAQLHQVRALDNRERVERQIWLALEECAEDVGLDPRVANALWDAFFERDVTAGYYLSLANVSRATATIDLATAVAAKFLRPEGERRGRRYLPTDHLYQTVGFALGIEVAGPPEVARGRLITELSRRMTWTGEAFGLDAMDEADQ